MFDFGLVRSRVQETRSFVELNSLAVNLLAEHYDNLQVLDVVKEYVLGRQLPLIKTPYIAPGVEDALGIRQQLYDLGEDAASIRNRFKGYPSSRVWSYTHEESTLAHAEYAYFRRQVCPSVLTQAFNNRLDYFLGPGVKLTEKVNRVAKFGYIDNFEEPGFEGECFDLSKNFEHLSLSVYSPRYLSDNLVRFLSDAPKQLSLRIVTDFTGLHQATANRIIKALFDRYGVKGGPETIVIHSSPASIANTINPLRDQYDFTGRAVYMKSQDGFVRV